MPSLYYLAQNGQSYQANLCYRTQYNQKMSEKENLPMLHTIRILPQNSKKNLFKTAKELPSVKSIKDKPLETMPDYEPHPADKYLYGTKPSAAQFKKFTSLLYQGLVYSVCTLKGPSEEYLRKKSIRLPQPKESKKKFLMLDLDETLIHSVWGDETGQVSIKRGEEGIRFNIRPHCLSFLEKMSNFFQIYVFTASTEDYAQPIVAHLNAKRKTIQGLLCRQNCLETHNGLRIKDLRIIKNRSLSDIVIVDNLVHSFGLQIDNGIPILDFTNNKDDRELLGIEKILIQLRNVEDVRDFLRHRIGLRKCLEIGQEEFLSVGRKGVRKA